MSARGIFWRRVAEGRTRRYDGAFTDLEQILTGDHEAALAVAPHRQGPSAGCPLMSERYWLVHPNGGRQLIDPREFDIGLLREQARRLGGELVAEACQAILSEPEMPTQSAEPAGQTAVAASHRPAIAGTRVVAKFEPPISALGPLFQTRLARIYVCEQDFHIDMNTRPTARVLGGYYRRRKLVRIYTHDRGTGRRHLEELFDTFLHEVAHHIEYTEPHTFNARASGRVPGRMHSRLFWRILGELKRRWFLVQGAES